MSPGLPAPVRERDDSANRCSPMRTDVRPMESREPLGRVARLHYQHGMTHQEIGELLGLSRVKVTRMLAEARRAGIVEIRIHGEATPFGELEAELSGAFGLAGAWIAPSFADPERSLASVGMAGAECLTALAPTVRTVAVGLSSSVAAIVAHLRPPEPLPELGFVPLAGSWGGASRGMSPHELVIGFGAAFGARTYHLPAPILARTADAAAAFNADPGVRQTLQLAAGAQLLIAGVGAVAAGSGILADTLTERERGQLTKRGAVGDISARFFDSAGRAVESTVDQRVVGMSLRGLARIPQRVAVGFGSQKITPLRAALSAGLMNHLVTDVDTARTLLRTTRKGN